MILLRHYQSQDVLLSLMPVGDISRGGNNLSGSRHQGFKTDMQSKSKQADGTGRDQNRDNAHSSVECFIWNLHGVCSPHEQFPT